MFRHITEEDHENYMRLTYGFYHLTDGADEPVPEYYRENTWKELMRSRENIDCVLFIDEKNDYAFGYGLLNFSWSQEVGGPIVNVEELYVEEAYRGNGTSKKFMQFVFDTYPDTKRFRLDVIAGHDSVIRLYKDCGFDFLEYLQMVIDIKY